MKCLKCGGDINFNESRSIFTPCCGEELVYPCRKCGLLHWGFNGNPVLNRKINSLIFLKEGKTIDEKDNTVDLRDQSK